MLAWGRVTDDLSGVGGLDCRAGLAGLVPCKAAAGQALTRVRAAAAGLECACHLRRRQAAAAGLPWPARRRGWRGGGPLGCGASQGTGPAADAGLRWFYVKCDNMCRSKVCGSDFWCTLSGLEIRLEQSA